MFDIVEPSCVEELGQLVEPWQLTLRQLSAGELQASVGFRAVNNIIISNDRWRAKIHGFGATAKGYITIIVINPAFPVCLKGKAVVENSLGWGPGNSDWDFISPHGTNHWVMLIPEKKLADFMGVASPEMLLSDSQVLPCSSQQFQRMHALAIQLLSAPALEGHTSAAAAPQDELECSVLDQVATILSGTAESKASSTERKRYAACRKATQYANNNARINQVSQLAAAADVSVRVLQLAFHENLGISPKRYLRLCQLNRLHSALRHTGRHEATVTELMLENRLDELGRGAVEYKWLYGESPSATLSEDVRKSKLCLRDASAK
jgi:AraC family ethanolamine operon transcriptional activator